MNTDQFKNKMINPTYITKSMEVRCEEPKPCVDFTDVINRMDRKKYEALVAESRPNE